jgi:steroid delta-isomerase-like uncharacterized protein
LDSIFTGCQPQLKTDFGILCFQWFRLSQLAVSELIWTAMIYHSLSGDMDREQMIEEFIMMASAFPDTKVSIDDMVAEGDKVAYRWTMRCTHKGTFMGIPATGKQIVVKGVEIYKIAGRKIIEAWNFPDTLGMLTQLGAIPGASPKA